MSRLVQLWTRVLCPRMAQIYILANDGHLTGQTVCAQVSELEIATLVFGAHAGVNTNPHI